jgi:hypothetical protein
LEVEEKEVHALTTQLSALEAEVGNGETRGRKKRKGVK